MQTRTFIKVAAGFACAAVIPFASFTAQAQTNFPDKPITLVVTVPPGGAADFAGRTMGEALSKQIGQPVLIENKAGASGTIATAYVAKAPADGYTLLQGAISTHGIGPHFYTKTSYDALKDFMSLGVIAEFPLVLAVNANLPVNNLQELIALAKQKDGKMSFASAGSGSAPHLTGELFQTEAGIKMLHVPYKGSAPAVVDVAGGQVDIMFDGFPSLMPHIKSGKLRAIAAVSPTRNALAPDLPTFTELGYPKMISSLWYMPMVPAKTPQAVVDRLNKALVEGLKGTDAQKRLEAGGAQMVYGTPAQTQAYIKSEYDRWGVVIKNAGISTSN
ncbi:Bug family tripartite tricarboxylate transporter substrate binding protein [Zwartia panacis]|uniref:Bug family tripartite tricarboxylate transporter substrate binding protein n=1 Tax=Zwartia panacis TaxID=2683345 RepID=UPI0025B44EA4|nr:tripartite tricarboxylate transporter substrate binding protein [Zwartia panacis]MDN4016516.1 tripartite tricarboxylate transporter substrate binding protein [Zwartia panacis]